MFFTILIFFVSLVAMVYMVILKIREIKVKTESVVLGFISKKFDPIAGNMIGFYNSVSISSFGRSFSLIGAKLGILTARLLFYVKNRFSKIAAHLYHHSRKIEANSANQPSFFIKTIKEYKNNLRNESSSSPKSTERQDKEGNK